MRVTPSRMNPPVGTTTLAVPNGMPRTNPLWAGLLVLLVGLPMAALSQYSAHRRTDETDAWLFRYFGQQLAEGRKLYVDLWDNKPPGIYWLNAVGPAFTNQTETVEVAFCALAALLACSAMFATVRMQAESGRAAALTFVLAAVYVFHPFLHAGANRPATFIVAAESLAAAFYLASFRGRRRGWKLLCAGLFAGVAPLFLQTAIALPLAVAIDVLRRLVMERSERGLRLARMSLFVVGGLAAPAMSVWMLHRYSDLPVAYEAIVGFSGRCFEPWQWSSWLPHWLDAHRQLEFLILPAILALATMICEIARNFDVAHPEREDKNTESLEEVSGSPTPFLVFWLVVAVYLALLPPNRKMHYFAPAIPPLILLAGYGVGRLLAWPGTSWGRYHVWVGVLWIAYMLSVPIEQHIVRAAAAYHDADSDRPSSRYETLVDAIHSHTVANDPIFVLGYDPQLYALSARPPACRFIGTASAVQLRQGGQAIADEIAAALTRYPPKVIVGDAAVIESMSRRPEEGEVNFQELAALIRNTYVQDDRRPMLWTRRMD